MPQSLIRTYLGTGPLAGKVFQYVESTNTWWMREGNGPWSTVGMPPPSNQITLFQTGTEPTSGLPGGSSGPYDPNAPGGSSPGGINDPNAPGDGDDGDGYDVQPGMWWQLEQEQMALQKYIADMQAQTQRDIARINNEAAAALAARQAELEMDLLEKRITHEQFMQERELAQRESEFTRDLALRTLIADRQYEIDQAQLKLNELAEFRQERLLHAQLAANPADTVLYEFYKRGGGTPEAMAAAQEQANTGYRSLLGDYPEPPPAYSDAALQELARGFTGEPGAQYNPRLGGTGAFGANVPSPNDLSRAQLAGMDPNTLGVLQSFIQAGVETSPGGPRIAINPEDWFRQAQQSWIPTVDTTQVKYV